MARQRLTGAKGSHTLTCASETNFARLKRRCTVVRTAVAFILVCGIWLPPPVRSAPALHPQYRIVAQFEDDAGPAVRLANGTVYRLERAPAARVVIPPVDRSPPARIIDQVERSYPGVLPKWFTAPDTGVKPRP